MIGNTKLLILKLNIKDKRQWWFAITDVFLTFIAEVHINSSNAESLFRNFVQTVAQMIQNWYINTCKNSWSAFMNLLNC